MTDTQKQAYKELKTSITLITERVRSIEEELRKDITTRHRLNLQQTLQTNKDLLKVFEDQLKRLG